MEILVIGIVFTVPQAFREEYAAAEARLNGGKATDSFMAAQQSFSNSSTTGMYPSLCWRASRIDGFLLGSWLLRRTKIQQPHWGEARGAEEKLGAKVVEGIRSSYFERCIV